MSTQDNNSDVSGTHSKSVDKIDCEICRREYERKLEIIINTFTRYIEEKKEEKVNGTKR